jgi:hypothetical protein
VELFEKVFQAAIAEGWTPTDQEQVGGAEKPVRERPAAEAAVEEPETPLAPPVEEEVPEEPVVPVVEEAIPEGRLFGGVDLGGEMRDRRDGTWLALGVLVDEKFRIVRLEPTGRSGLQGYLRDPDRALMNAEAIGFNFPFALPGGFSEKLLKGPFPEEGWWGLARGLEKTSYPDYLVALQEFREEHGEVLRWTDEKTGALSPLHRTGPDRGPMAYHGIRMIAEERSRYVIRPFESAQGRLLLEVYPGALVRKLGLDEQVERVDRVAAILQALAKLEHLPVVLEGQTLARCRGRLDALEAVLAARCAAVAVLSGEADRSPEELAPDSVDRVRTEGWIYGVGE